MNDNLWRGPGSDRWFQAALVGSGLAVAWLFLPFFDALFFAAVVASVAWPMHQRILARVRGRRTLAAGLTVAILGVAIFGPLSGVFYLFLREAVHVVAAGKAFIDSGQLAASIRTLLELQQDGRLPPWLRSMLPRDLEAIAGPAQSAALGLLNTLGAVLPRLVGSTVHAVIHTVIFGFGVFSFLVKGPRWLRAFRRLSPLHEAHEQRLIDVFREYANSMVVGSLATALVQGVVAGVGYGIAGVERVLFYATLTAVFSFVPLVGTVIIWLPVSIGVGVQFGWKWGVFLLAWSALLTTQVDGVVRPMFMRGKTKLHPLLVFLAAFGGLAWMGVIGAVVGPLLVAIFAALYNIFEQPERVAAPSEGLPAEPAPAPLPDR